MTTTPDSKPRYDLNRVFRIKRAIEQDLDIACFVGTKPEGADFDALVRAFRVRVPIAEREALKKSLLALTGQPLTRAALAAMAWRLAGNLTSLKAGQPVLPWSRQQKAEWVPLQIIDAKPRMSKKGRKGSLLQFRVLAGSPCTRLIEKFWSREFCAVVARRLGFSRFRSGKYPWQHPKQMVGMRLLVEITPQLSRDGPDFEHVHPASGSLLAYNRSLLRARTPATRTCPRRFTHPCHLCAVGMDRCDLATHARTYVTRLCRVCRENKLHDPATNEDLCMDCQERRMREEQGHTEKEGL